MTQEPPIYELGDSKEQVLVLVHGGPGFDYSYFFPFLRPLAAHMMVVAYRLGYSGAQDMEGYSRELEEVVARYSHRRVFLLGHSFGGAIVLAAMGKKEFAGRVAKLILVSWIHSHEWLEAFRKGNPDYLTPEVKSGDEDTRLRQITLSAIPLYFTSTFQQVGLSVLGKVRYNGSLSNAAKGFMGRFSFADDLCHISASVLSIKGSKDRVVLPEHIRFGEALLGSCTVVELDAGHFPFVEKAEVFCNAA